MTEPCKHCGKPIIQRDRRHLHLRTLDTECEGSAGLQAAPYGEPCRVDCAAHEPGIRAVP